MELTPNQIAFLNYLNGLPKAEGLPEYWKYNYGVDSKKSAEKFIKLDLIEYKRDYKKGLLRLSVPELKDILKNNSLKLAGKKEDLVDRILGNVDIDIIDTLLKEKNFYVLTNKGQDLLKECEICVLNIKRNYCFTDIEIENALRLPKSYSTYDRLWSIFVERNATFPRRKKWGWYSLNIQNMGDLLYSENKYEQALTYYISVFIIDLSGILENNYVQELKYLSIPTPLIKNIKSLIDLAEIDLEKVKSIIDSDIASKCLPFHYYSKETIYRILCDCLNGIVFDYSKYPHNTPSTDNQNYMYYDYSTLNEESSKANKNIKSKSYQIIDSDTVEIGNKQYNKKQIKKRSLIFLIFAVILFVIGFYVFPFLILSLIFFYASCKYRRIYKELGKK